MQVNSFAKFGRIRITLLLMVTQNALQNIPGCAGSALQFHCQRYPLFLQIHAQHFHIHDIPDAHDLQRVFHKFLCRKLRNMN